MAVLEVKSINRKSGAQMRVQPLDENHLAELTDAYRGNQKLPPPPVVYWDGSEHWLAEGFHRVEAAIRAGRKQLDVEIRKGTQRHAICHGTGANAHHGLKRADADKRRAVETLLRDEEWGKRSKPLDRCNGPCRPTSRRETH